MRSNDGTLKLRAEFASSKAEIYDANDDGSQDVRTVLEKRCRKSIQTGLLIRTITDELNYFIYSSGRKNTEVWRCCMGRRIMRRVNRTG